MTKRACKVYFLESAIVNADMRRLMSSIVLASLLLMTLSFAGMAFFGMPGTDMGMGQCIGGACGPMPMSHGSDANCLDHCIRLVSPAATAVAIDVIAMFFSFIIFFSQIFLCDASIDDPRRRLREGIGKFLRHKNLSTVILRN